MPLELALYNAPRSQVHESVVVNSCIIPPTAKEIKASRAPTAPTLRALPPPVDTGPEVVGSRSYELPTPSPVGPGTLLGKLRSGPLETITSGSPSNSLNHGATPKSMESAGARPTTLHEYLGAKFVGSRSVGLQAQVHPWGYYAGVPVSVVSLNFVLVVIQFAAFLSLVGWVETFVESQTRVLRALPSLALMGWSVAAVDAICELCLGRRISALDGIVSTVTFTLCWAIFASLPEAGFMIQVLGAIVLHLLVMMGWIILVKLGVWLEATTEEKKGVAYRFLYFQGLLACTLFAIANGFGACIWWPILDDEFGFWSGPFLYVASSFGEAVSLMLIRTLDNRYYKRVRNARLMASWMIMLVHSVSESLRLVCLLYEAIRAPGNDGWIGVVVFSLFANAASRLGWHHWLGWRLTRMNPFWVPGCWTLVHRSARYVFGYDRFGALLGVLVARLILGSDVPQFSERALWVLGVSLVAGLFENVLVVSLEFMGYEPDWYGHQSFEEYAEMENRKDPHNAVVPVTIHVNGKVQHKVPFRLRPFESPLTALSIANVSTLISLCALAMLVSVDFILGNTTEFKTFPDDIHNGAVLWLAPGS